MLINSYSYANFLFLNFIPLLPLKKMQVHLHTQCEDILLLELNNLVYIIFRNFTADNTQVVYRFS